MGDSYYEYLLKMWLYTGKANPHPHPKPTPTPEQLIFTEGGYTLLAESNNKKAEGHHA